MTLETKGSQDLGRGLRTRTGDIIIWTKTGDIVWIENQRLGLHQYYGQMELMPSNVCITLRLEDPGNNKSITLARTDAVLLLSLSIAQKIYSVSPVHKHFFLYIQQQHREQEVCETNHFLKCSITGNVQAQAYTKQRQQDKDLSSSFKTDQQSRANIEVEIGIILVKSSKCYKNLQLKVQNVVKKYTFH